jgi:tRNA modification GTPase
VARARATLAECPIALWTVDASAPLEADDRAVAEALSGKRVIIAMNKSDLPGRIEAGEVRSLVQGEARVVAASARTGDGVSGLRDALATMLGGDGAGGHARHAPGNQRHVDALARARAALGRATEAGEAAAPGEIVALELREALAALGEVTGQSVSDDLLERIFSRFCVGK